MNRLKDRRFSRRRWSLFAPFLVLLAGASCRTPKPAPPAAMAPPILLPISQILTPAGKQTLLPELRPQVMAMSPDGKMLVASGKSHELVVLDASTGEIRQQVALPADTPGSSSTSTHLLKPDEEGQASYTGLVFSRDGRKIFLSNVNGSIKRFSVSETGEVRGEGSIPLGWSGLVTRREEIPSGLALSEDGRKLYVVLNLSNRLAEYDVESGRRLRVFPTGVAPYDLRLARGKIYVSNWGGRVPDASSVTGPAGQGTKVRVDPVRHIASEGSVTVIDPRRGKPGEVVAEIQTGLHASGLAVHGVHLAVANAASDTVSVIDTRTDRVIETISLRWQPSDYFGASPNALAFDRSGRTLYVCNGTQNAVAVVAFRPGASRLLGLIPVGWFPGAMVYDAKRSLLHVANIKGIGSGRRAVPDDGKGMNSHQYMGSISRVPIPNREELVAYTRTVLANCRREIIEASQLPPRSGVAPRPVPERAGEPSVFKHVVYIIKENRTYDQVLGDVPGGNGDPRLCVFGEKFTPNQHKIARDFVLLDNTHCSGILSADGHQWATTAFATDYMEKSFAGFPRSYPDGMEDDDVDALAYAPTGFIWDNVLEHGKTLRDYGEFAIGITGWREPSPGKPGFLDFYNDYVNGTARTRVASRPAIESLRPHLNTNTIGWAMEVPDQFRASQFIQELREFEKTGNFPNLAIICLPNDHTSGTKAGKPTPGAHVADNDLAFGRIVEAISHSRFWKDTCIFAIEDDPQAGWDHVSGYRTTAYVVSPYTKRGAVVSTRYDQPGMLRSIELILGLPPMNQMDAAATPMSDCFQENPDFAPFDAVPNQVALDEINPPSHTIRDPVLRRNAELSARLPLEKPDQCDEDRLNRILWHQMKGPREPYPVWAVIPKDKR